MNDSFASNARQMVILPLSFTDRPKNMNEKMHDAILYVRDFRKSGFFYYI